MSSDRIEPPINKNQFLQDYYAPPESRIGFRLVLGGTRNFTLHTRGTYWPFSIGKALWAMEDNLIAGYVAIHAEEGYHVYGKDAVDHYIKAQRNIKMQGLEGTITVTKGDHHQIDAFVDHSLVGAYTMETFVHANKPEAVAAEFFRVIQPRGSITMHEYAYLDPGRQFLDSYQKACRPMVVFGKV